MRKSLSLEQLDVFPSYKGGRTCVFGGYVWEFSPGHPLQNHWGWVAQHRLVAEDKIGRPLRQGKNPNFAEHAHHKDDCRTNNHPDNIEVLTKSQHHTLHSRSYSTTYKGAKIPEETVREALEKTGSIKGAARALAIHHMTIRTRWPHLISHMKRKSPIQINNPSILKIIQEMAADPSKTIYDIAKQVGTNPRTISRVCVRHNFVWESNRPSVNPHKMPTHESIAPRGILPGTVIPKGCRLKNAPARKRNHRTGVGEPELLLDDPQAFQRRRRHEYP